jgi:hypothetical protein
MVTPFFRIRSLRATLVLVLLSGLLQPAIVAADDSCGSVSRLIISLRFAQVLYPELKGKEFGIAVSPGTGSFVAGRTEADDLAVRLDDEGLWHPPDEKPNQYYAGQTEATRTSGIELPLYLYFSFIDVRGTLKARHLACQPVHFTSDVGHIQMEKVKSTLARHPEWSDAQELEVARKLGLRFGPEDKSALLRLIPLKELSSFYGPLKIKSATFSMNAGTKCAGCSFAGPAWYISAAKVNTGQGLSLVIEPFFGRISSLTE